MRSKEKLRDYYLEERVRATISIIEKVYDKKNVVITDLGCGDGRATTEIIARLSTKFIIDKFYAVDLKPNKELQHKYSFVEIIMHDFNFPGLSINDKSVDIVYSLETIEHLYNPDTFLEEISRILKPGGLLIITTVNMLAWYNRFLFLLGSLPVHYEVSSKGKYGRFKILEKGAPVGHIRVFSPKALKEMFDDLGFKVVDIIGLQFIYKPPLSYIDKLFKKIPNWSSAFLIAAIKR